MEVEDLTWDVFHAISNADNAGYEGTAQALRDMLPDVEQALEIEQRLKGNTLEKALAEFNRRKQL